MMPVTTTKSPRATSALVRPLEGSARTRSSTAPFPTAVNCVVDPSFYEFVGVGDHVWYDADGDGREWRNLVAPLA